MSVVQGRDDASIPRIVTIGASAGGLEPLLEICRSLPATLDAAVLVVMHVSSSGPSRLPHLLGARSPLPAAHAQNGESLRPGAIRVAPPDHHLLVDDGATLRVVRGPRENRTRPAVDPLFRSAALAFGPRVIGVVLSGTLDDGAAGLATIRAAGGVAVVQDPEEAMYPGMPSAAIRVAGADHCVPAGRIGPTIVELVAAPDRRRFAGTHAVDPGARHDDRIARLELSAVHDQQRPGRPSAFGCPDCGGALWEIDASGPLRFRCRVGHSYGVDALLDGQRTSVEHGLWNALRALEEQASLAERLADRAREDGDALVAEGFAGQARAAHEQAESIRGLILVGQQLVATDDRPAEEQGNDRERAATSGDAG